MIASGELIEEASCCGFGGEAPFSKGETVAGGVLCATALICRNTDLGAK